MRKAAISTASLSKFRVRPGQKVILGRWPTLADPLYSSKEDWKRMRKDHLERLNELQEILYAHDRYSLLLIFQAMDAAGKDSAIEHVMSGVNPQGCQVFSFKHPSAEEADHDFLWRCVCRLPERGRIGIFNRSYYEDVLIVRVHPQILGAQKVPEELRKAKGVWEERYRSIRELERHLDFNGTRIVKFFLHISKEEQKRRFLARIDRPEKNWKFSEADLKERNHWPEYMKAYTECLSATSTKFAPWYVVPADDKPNAQLIISRAIIDALESMELSYPSVDAARKKELKRIRERLADE